MKKLLLIVKFFFIIFFSVIYYTSSQTQELAKKGIKIDLVFCSDAGYKGVYLGTKCPSSRKNKISYTNYLKQNSNLCYLKNNSQELKIIQTEAPCNSIYDKSGIPIIHKGNGNFYVYGIDSLDIQIAKETTQTDSSNDIVEEEKKAKNIVDIVFCKKKNSNDIYPRLRKNLCKSGGYGVEDSSYQEYLKFYEHKRICFKKKLNQIGSFSDCYPENEIYYVKYDGNNFIIDPDQTKKGKKDPVKNNDGLLTALEETEKKLKELKGEKKETKKLNIEIKKVVEETDVIKINEAYSLKCEIEMEDANVTIVSKVVNSKKLRIEGIMSFGDDGDIFFKTDSNIKSNGKISQGKSKTDYSENFDKNLKKAMKKNEGMFTNMTSLNFNTFNLYGKTLIPIKVKDKKKSKVMLDLMKMLVKHDNELKKVIKNLKVNWYDHYLGIANIQEEKFYVLKSYLEMKHPEFGWQVVFNELYAENDTMYVLIHVDSGYTIAMASTLKPICIIYKQNKEVIKVDSSDIIY